MKAMKKLLIALLSLTAIITTSCKNDMGNLGTVKGDGITAGKSVEFTITTTADYTLFPEDKDINTARTIVSDGYAESELKFYLFGTNTTTNKPLAPQVVTFTKDGDNARKGTTNLQIGSYVWNLYIAACDKTDLPEEEDTPTKDAVIAKAVLLGEVTADLRGSNKTVDFVLTPDGLSKKGTVDMKIYTSGWTLPENYKVNISLLTRSDEKELSTTSPTKYASEKTSVENLTKDDIGTDAESAYKYKAGEAEIVGGKYKFQAEFVAPTGKKYYYSDDIIILPGKGNTSTVKIPYVIEVAPSAPTVFKVGYIAPTDSSDPFYTAVFEWTRSSTKTEKYYELEIMNLGIPTDPSKTYSFIANIADAVTDDTEWNTQKGYASADTNDKTTVKTYGENFYANKEICVSGSLMKANEFVCAKLNLGNRYNARIRAINEAGESEWVYVSTADITKNDDTKKPAATAYTSTTMNLYRLKYEVEGYTWTSGPTSYVTYHCETSSGIAIKHPNGEGDDGTLKDSYEAVYTNWKDYNEPNVAPAAYDGFENKTLIPIFAKAANISIYNDKDYLIPVGDIALSNGLSIENDKVNIDIGTIAADANGAKNITWTITFPAGKVYTSVYLTMARTSAINNPVYSENITKANNTFTMNVAGLEGTYIAILHYTINGREYTTPITVTIQE